MIIHYCSHCNLGTIPYRQRKANQCRGKQLLFCQSLAPFDVYEPIFLLLLYPHHSIQYMRVFNPHADGRVCEVEMCSLPLPPYAVVTSLLSSRCPRFTSWFLGYACPLECTQSMSGTIRAKEGTLRWSTLERHIGRQKALGSHYTIVL